MEINILSSNLLHVNENITDSYLIMYNEDIQWAKFI